MPCKKSSLLNEKQKSLNSIKIGNDKSQVGGSNTDDNNREDIDFIYDDTDVYTAEIAELYSYAEEKEFFFNKMCFYENLRKVYGSSARWIKLNDTERKKHILRICNLFDSSFKDVRDKAARCLLYILQGVFGECEYKADQIIWTRHNVFICLECGVLDIIIDLLLFEIKYKEWQSNSGGTEASESNLNKKNKCKLPSSSGSELRVVLNQLYIIIETVRNYKLMHKLDSKEKINSWTLMTDNLIEELNGKITSLGSVEEAPSIIIVLFGMVNRFCSGLAPNFPIKKVLLVLWKMSLLVLGPVTNMFEAKNEKRAEMSMSLLTEDSNKIAKNMKATYFLPVSKDNLINTSSRQRPIKSRSRNRLNVSYQKRPVQGSFTRGRVNSKMVSVSTYDNIPASFRLNLPTTSQTTTKESSSLLFKKYIKDKRSESDENDCMSDDDSLSSDTLKQEDNDDSDDERTLMIDDDLVEDGDEVNAKTHNSSEINDENQSLFFNTNKDTIDDIHTNQSDSYIALTNNQNNFSDGTATPRPSSPVNINMTNDEINRVNITNVPIEGHFSIDSHNFRTLPWKPKVRLKDLQEFMATVRAKYIGYTISRTDTVTVAGLPDSIQAAIKVLKSHIYVSIGDVQMRQEKDIIHFPLTIGSKEVIKDTPVEILYRNMLPHIPQYMISILKVLLAAVTISKSKTGSINILNDIMLDGPTKKTYKFHNDMHRHKEIVIKAISGLLLLLLKHFKLNHIYQFEYVSQYLVFANCIQLILKFFNQNIINYVQAKNSIPTIDFPSCVIESKLKIPGESLENIIQSKCCWRNVFSCINLLRILNMLTKWKHSRTMTMVTLKSQVILKRSLKIRQAMLQMYILKLIKSQTRYFPKYWRKTNVQIISAIYQKVRHRLTDDWAHKNDEDARPWDVLDEECNLRNSIKTFHTRRYTIDVIDPELLINNERDVTTITAPKKPKIPVVTSTI